MSWFIGYARSSIGAKQIMAVTGLGMLLFAIVHMLGHLGMFSGREAYNSYAAFLQGLGGIKWALRGGLLAILVAHIATAVVLVRANAAARPHKYAVQRFRRTTFAARSMALTGLVVAAFIVYHLMHFTIAGVGIQDFGKLDAAGLIDVHRHVVTSFKMIPVALAYIVANSLLGVHLWHGLWSLFQSLGWANPRFNDWRRMFAIGFAALVVVGNVSFPVAVLAGIVKV